MFCCFSTIMNFEFKTLNVLVPTILRKYPANYADESLKTTTSFAYPCKIPSYDSKCWIEFNEWIGWLIFRDEQGEHFAFVVLDSTGTLFRFGYCRRSNRDATCLCIIRYKRNERFLSIVYCRNFSFYPWFEPFYNMLSDIAQIMTTKSVRNQYLFDFLFRILSNE